MQVLARRCPILHASLVLLVLLASGTARSATWTPVNLPILQTASAAIYDPVRDRVVEFGGAAETPLNLARALSLAGPSTWSSLAPAGTPPPPRAYHVAIYDAVRDRMVVFGGIGAGPPELADTWALEFSPTLKWTQLPSGASINGLDVASAVYDAPRDRMLLFGGSCNCGAIKNDVWSYDFSAGTGWSLVTTAGVPPSPRGGHAMVLDTARNRVLVLGGFTESGLPSTVDVYALTLSGTPTWSAVTTTGTPPACLTGVRGVYDPANDRVLLFGGYSNCSGGYQNAVWSLSLAGTPTWTNLSIAPPRPDPRYYHQAVWDAARSRLLALSGTRLGDGGLWALSTGATPAWSLVQPDTTSSFGIGPTWLNVDNAEQRLFFYTGTGTFTLPLAGSQDLVLMSRQQATGATFMFIDPARHRLDGITVDAGGVTKTFDYDAPDPAWVDMGSGFSNSVFSTAGIYDAAGDRLVFYGKDGVLQTAPAGSLAWTSMPTSGVAPAPRIQANVAFDPATRRMWVQGGDVSCACDNGDRLYALDLSGFPTWISKPVAAGPRPPGPRRNSAAAWDTHGNRMLLYGGSGFTDTWQLTTFGDSLRWTQIVTDAAPASTTEQLSGAYDAVHDRFLVSGEGFERIFALTPPAAVDVAPPVAAPNLAFSVGPNPVRHGTLALHLTLPEAGDVRVALLDVAGRTALTRLEHRPAGNQEIAFATTGIVRPGLYLVRVQAGRHEAVRRIAVIE